jgi:bifunctional non-homologous end joining protein LigD
MVTVHPNGFVEPCIPTRAAKPPAGPDWVHEIKRDGRYPAIAGAAAKLTARSFTIDGEAVVCGPDGVAVFEALHRRQRVHEAILYAFDLLELDGEDLRHRPLGERKARLAKLLGRKPYEIVFNEHTDADGGIVFRHACKLGLEGIVSKRLSKPYQSGRSGQWLKIKNPDKSGDDPGT